MRIYRISKSFPQEERFLLSDQIRRASSCVCSNLAEGWRKRKYVAVFKNKITDSMMAGSETQCWFEYNLACNYVNQEEFDELNREYEEIIAMLNSMEMNADKFFF